MFAWKHARAATLIAAGATLLALALPATATADKPVRADSTFIRDFDNPYLCDGFTVHGHAVSHQVFVGFGDGSFALHIDEDEVFTAGDRSAVVATRYNSAGGFGWMKSEGRSQLWTADGRLLYTAAGALSFTIDDGNVFTPHYDPGRFFDELCSALAP